VSQLKGTLLPTGEGYVYRWGDPQDPDLVTIQISEMRLRNGSPYCVLTTYTNLPGARSMADGHVLSSEVWLRNERGRGDYAAALTRLIPAPPNATPIDFGAMLEEVARLVIEHQTNLLDITRLNGNLAQQAPTAYLVQGVIPAHLPTILYGAGGVGKSILAATIAVAVQHGVKVLDRLTQQADVLYLDWETDAADIGRRMHAAAAGLGVEHPSLLYASLAHPLESRLTQLARMVAEEKIGLVIVDSVGMAMGPSPAGGDASESAIRFFGALRRLGTGVLAIDHISGDDMRRGGKGAGKPYGSVYKWNITRNAFELREARDPDMHGVHLLLKHRKTNIGSRQSDMPLRLLWDNVRGIATFGPDTAPVAAPSGQPLNVEVFDLLQSGPATVAQIAEMLDAPEVDVRRACSRLIVAGKVHAYPNGQVGLTQDRPNGVQSTLLDA
jgi:hypothetical protein